MLLCTHSKHVLSIAITFWGFKFMRQFDELRINELICARYANFVDASKTDAKAAKRLRINFKPPMVMAMPNFWALSASGITLQCGITFRLIDEQYTAAAGALTGTPKCACLPSCHE